MDNQVWQVGVLIVSSLVGVIGILWKLLLSHNKERVERLKKYEAKEEIFNAEIRAVSNKVSRLEGEKDGQNRGIEQIVKAVTDEIRYSRQEAYKAGEEAQRTAK